MKVFGGLERFWFRGRDARFNWGREIGWCADDRSGVSRPREAGRCSVVVVSVWARVINTLASVVSGGDVNPACGSSVPLAVESSCAVSRGDGSHALAVSYCRRSSSQLSIQ